MPIDWQLKKKGYIAMSGQIVDAALVPAPKQHHTEEERQAINDGRSARLRMFCKSDFEKHMAAVVGN